MVWNDDPRKEHVKRTRKAPMDNKFDRGGSMIVDVGFGANVIGHDEHDRAYSRAIHGRMCRGSGCERRVGVRSVEGRWEEKITWSEVTRGRFLMICRCCESTSTIRWQADSKSVRRGDALISRIPHNGFQPGTHGSKASL